MTYAPHAPDAQSVVCAATDDCWTCSAVIGHEHDHAAYGTSTVDPCHTWRRAPLKTYANLVDLAESGDHVGRIANRGGTWRRAEVSNDPGTIVLSSKGTSWCYEIGALLHDERLREAIRRTAAYRAPASA